MHIPSINLKKKRKKNERSEKKMFIHVEQKCVSYFVTLLQHLILLLFKTKNICIYVLTDDAYNININIVVFFFTFFFPTSVLKCNRASYSSIVFNYCYYYIELLFNHKGIK